MKKKIVIVVIIIVVVLLLLLCNYVFNVGKGHYPKKLSNNGKYNSSLPKEDVLINYSFMNGAWSYTYYGEIVLKDGSRYAFNCTERGENNCKLKKKRSISSNDLKKIKKYESQLKDKVTYENRGADMGELSIVYYKDKNEYILAGRGDNTITNSSFGAKKILKVLKKYGIYV